MGAVLVIGGFSLMYAAVGSADCGTLSFERAVICGLIGAAVMTAGMVLARAEA